MCLCTCTHLVTYSAQAQCLQYLCPTLHTLSSLLVSLNINISEIYLYRYTYSFGELQSISFYELLFLNIFTHFLFDGLLSFFSHFSLLQKSTPKHIVECVSCLCVSFFTLKWHFWVPESVHLQLYQTLPNCSPELTQHYLTALASITKCHRLGGL